MSDIKNIRSIAELHREFGIEKPLHPLVSVMYHDAANQEARHVDYGDQRYTMDLYYIAIKDHRTSPIGYGRRSFDFEEGSMIFMGPGQVIAPGNMEEKHEPKGWSLVFHPDLIRKSDLGKKIDRYSFFSYDVHEALHLSDAEERSLTDLVDKIHAELGQNLDKYSQHLITGTIELMLDYCNRYYDRQFLTRSDFNSDAIAKFDRALKSYYQSGKQLELGIPSVHYFGEALHMSSHYLSDLLKKETGKNALEHIHRFVVEKAKTSLLGSTDSISQVAFSLGFEYHQHFSKIFKKKTGMSPAQYRSLN